jgi:thiol:disulfide interchange protein
MSKRQSIANCWYEATSCRRLISEPSLTVGLMSRLLAVIYLCCSLSSASASLSQEPSLPRDAGVLEPVVAKSDLYPADADAKKEIEDAVKQAAAGKKRLLLVFGANWCYDCHVLDRALHEGSAGKVMKESFLLVHVDIGEADKNLDLLKKYKIPLEKGVPAVAILGRDGKLLYSSGDGEFEAARKMMKQDLVAFLKQWKE